MRTRMGNPFPIFVRELSVYKELPLVFSNSVFFVAGLILITLSFTLRRAPAGVRSTLCLIGCVCAFVPLVYGALRLGGRTLKDIARIDAPHTCKELTPAGTRDLLSNMVGGSGGGANTFLIALGQASPDCKTTFPQGPQGGKRVLVFSTAAESEDSGGMQCVVGLKEHLADKHILLAGDPNKKTGASSEVDDDNVSHIICVEESRHFDWKATPDPAGQSATVAMRGLEHYKSAVKEMAKDFFIDVEAMLHMKTKAVGRNVACDIGKRRAIKCRIACLKGTGRHIVCLGMLNFLRKVLLPSFGNRFVIDLNSDNSDTLRSAPQTLYSLARTQDAWNPACTCIALFLMGCLYPRIDKSKGLKPKYSLDLNEANAWDTEEIKKAHSLEKGILDALKLNSKESLLPTLKTEHAAVQSRNRDKGLQTLYDNCGTPLTPTDCKIVCEIHAAIQEASTYFLPLQLVHELQDGFCKNFSPSPLTDAVLKGVGERRDVLQAALAKGKNDAEDALIQNLEAFHPEADYFPHEFGANKNVGEQSDETISILRSILTLDGSLFSKRSMWHLDHIAYSTYISALAILNTDWGPILRPASAEIVHGGNDDVNSGSLLHSLWEFVKAVLQNDKKNTVKTAIENLTHAIEWFENNVEHYRSKEYNTRDEIATTQEYQLVGSSRSEPGFQTHFHNLNDIQQKANEAAVAKAAAGTAPGTAAGTAAVAALGSSGPSGASGASGASGP